MPKTGIQMRSGKKSGGNSKKKSKRAADDDEEDDEEYVESPGKVTSKSRGSHRNKSEPEGQFDGSEDDEEMSDPDSENESEYDGEDDDGEADRMDGFIDDGDDYDGEEDEDYQEKKKKKDKKKKKKKEKKREYEESSHVSDEDIELINENNQRTKVKKKLVKLNRAAADEKEDGGEEDEFKRRDHGGRKNAIKRDFIEDDYGAEVDTRGYESNKKPGYDHPYPGGSILKDLDKDYEEDDDEVQQDMELLDKIMLDETEDVFTTPQDREIIETDVPERLQLKLKNRMNPPDESLRGEAQWIYNIIWEQNDTRDNQDGLQKTQDYVEKIFKVLRMIRVEHLDIPYIIRYKMMDLKPELSPEYIWKLFNLDIEYGKFEQQKKQLKDFFTQIKGISDQNHDIDQILNQIHYINSSRELKDYNALVDFYKSYYQKELDQLALSSGKKLPVKRTMFVRIAREKKLDEFSRRCTISPSAFVENLENNDLIHKPNLPTQISPVDMAKEFTQDTNDKEQIKTIYREMCVYTAIELWCHPEIRGRFKKHVKERGTIKTVPTFKGEKELDLLHPCYRVKRVNKRIQDLITQNTDLFLDILQNESQGLITCTIIVQNQEDYFDKLFEKYQSQDPQGQGGEYNKKWMQLYSEIQRTFTSEKVPKEQKESEWSKSRKEITRIFCQDNSMINSKVEQPFIQSIIDEVKEELKEDAENYVLQQCRIKYREMIQMGFFSLKNEHPNQGTDKRLDILDDEIIHQRERLNVMSAVIHPEDNRNVMTTLAVVNKEGDLQCHQDLFNLIKPRQRNNKNDGHNGKPPMRPQEQSRPIDEANLKKYNEAKKQFQELLNKYKVDLIVVCADNLEAKKLMTSIMEIVKDVQIDNQVHNNKPHVIWGRPEIPKLFASSHYSQKLLKNHSFILKKAICLARYEQDPMNEILNLWSSIQGENEALNLSLHPLQKNVNRARLMDVLEEINIQFLNKVGVDINLVIDHEHMFNQLQFLSGFGPRKAQQLIKMFKLRKNRVIQYRQQLLEKEFMHEKCFESSIGFIKISAPKKNIRDKNDNIEYLDQTRVHCKQYQKMRDLIAKYLYPDQDVKDPRFEISEEEIKNLLRNPQKLFESIQDKANMQGLSLSQLEDLETEQMITDFTEPFVDPREDKELCRDINNQELKFTTKQLMYALINQTERTFMQGMIVSATVISISDKREQSQVKYHCRLENGLDAKIYENDADFFTDRGERIQKGKVVHGRVMFDKSQKQAANSQADDFNITLKCRKEDLMSHDSIMIHLGYGINEVPEQDRRNTNFQFEDSHRHHHREERRPKIQKRKIQHPRFQNIPSTVAISLLNREENGEFYFRPSSQGNNMLTLTWKLFDNIIVHIDIQEFDRAPGATIGSRLKIQEEYYDTLQEVVERYITICNRHVREVTQHPKFFPCKNISEVHAELDKEKAEASSKIPYKFTMLPDYPHYIVLCYIPSKSFVREFIKVKPRGFLFHGQYHQPFQNLVTWFKSEFSTQEYKTYLRSSYEPPKISAPQPQHGAGNGHGGTHGSGPGNPSGRGPSSRYDNIYGQTTHGMQIDQGGAGDHDNYHSGNTIGGGGGGNGNYFNDPYMTTKHDDPTSSGYPARPKLAYGRGQRGGTPGGAPMRKGPGMGPEDDRRSPPHGTRAADMPSMGHGYGSTPWGGGEPREMTPGGGDPHGGDAWNRRRTSGGMDDMQGPTRHGGGPPGYDKKRSCYNCGGDDHFLRDCKNPPNRGGPPRGPPMRGAGRGRGHNGGPGGPMDSARGSQKCFKCQQDGHIARLCPYDRKDSRPPPMHGSGNESDDNGAPYKKRRIEEQGGNYGQKFMESNWQQKGPDGETVGGGYGNDDSNFDAGPRPHVTPGGPGAPHLPENRGGWGNVGGNPTPGE